MILFACEWCKAIKQPDEVWILGFAGETIGITAARREITIASSWDYNRAVLPLAVHFCSVEHKDNYVEALFESAPLPRVEVAALLETPQDTTTTVAVKKRRVTRKKIA